LLRTALLRQDAQEHVLLLTLHHIITDGWSNEVFMRELATLYRGSVVSQPSSVGSVRSGIAPDHRLPPLPVPYADYSLWQRSWLQGEVLDAELSYWRRQLADISPMALPTDHPRPKMQTHRGAVEACLLGDAVFASLRALSRAEQVTLFML